MPLTRPTNPEQRDRLAERVSAASYGTVLIIATLLLIGGDGDTTRFARVAEWTPTPAELQQYAGRYASDEAETWFTISVANGRLVRTDRYGQSASLTPSYKDAFAQGGVLVTFRRDAAGRVVALSLGLGRVRDLRFERQ